MQSSREIRIATAIFPTLSLLNHSCCPNTSLAFSTGTSAEPRASDLSADFSEREAEHKHEAPGVAVTVRAAKVIAPGQEILHCYGEILDEDQGLSAFREMDGKDGECRKHEQ